MSQDKDTEFNLTKLFLAARHGDRGAENELLSHLTVSFRLLAKRKVGDKADAEELVQETLMTVIAKHKDIAADSNFAAWAYSILKNKILNHFKTRQTRQRLRERHVEYFTPGIVRPSDIEFTDRLIDCFRRLNERNNRHARILNLHYQGYDTDEICTKMKLTRNHLYVLLSRARRELEICLDNKDGGKS